MGDLYTYFRNNPGRLIAKWSHYFAIYERHLAAYRNRPIVLVEFGVSHGGSLQMWRHYFGAQARIVGVDINPACEAFAEPGIEVVIGDQADPALHARLRAKYGELDVVIDDGGHTMEQQRVTFEALYPAVKAGGVYIAEDLHTSYHADWGGGLRKPGTFIEHAKTLIDQLHAWYGPIPGLQVDDLTRTAYALHFYDSMLVIEKQAVQPPLQLATGKPSLPMLPIELRQMAEHDLRNGNAAGALEKFRELLRMAPGDKDIERIVGDLASRAK
jgi:cephalosporin hydroxylase